MKWKIFGAWISTGGIEKWHDNGFQHLSNFIYLAVRNSRKLISVKMNRATLILPASPDCLSVAEQRHIEEYRSISPRDRIILDTTLSKMAEIVSDLGILALCSRFI